MQFFFQLKFVKQGERDKSGAHFDLLAVALLLKIKDMVTGDTFLTS